MADIKISELTQVSALNNGDLVEVSQVNALAPSGYTSLKASMTDLGKKVNTDIEYTTELSDFADKTPLGAIKETAKDKNVADEYDGTQTYDKGDVVIYKNTLYICTTNNTTGTTSVTSSLVGAVNSIIAGLQGSEQNIITPTASGVTNYSSFGNSWYLQRGKLVWVHIGVQGLTPNASHTITNLPTALRPITNVCSGGQGGETYTAYATCSVANNGDVKVASVDHYAIVDLIYIAKA